MLKGDVDEATSTGVSREAGGKESRKARARPRCARKGKEKQRKRGQGDAKRRKEPTPDNGKLVWPGFCVG
jgi:hypothetical protein